MLRLAWLCFVAWILLVWGIASANGFAGPAFWSSHLVLLLGLIAWAVHFKRKGYSRGEIILLCVFAILLAGGVAGAAGVDGYGANQRTRSKRTQADMRTIGSAWEAFATRTNQYNAAGLETADVSSLKYTFGPDALAPMLAPTYIKVFPQTDGWGHAWQFATDEPLPRGKAAAAQTYFVRSAGANGRFDPIVPGHVANNDCDIVYSNGTFISW